MRVLFVEDHPWVRKGVGAALVGCEVTVCKNGMEAAAAMGTTFDVALVDIVLPDVSGLDVIRALKVRQPACPAVMFTKFDDAETVLEALQAGARGYLLKSTPSDRIVPALRDAMAGGLPLTPTVASLVVASMLKGPERAAVPLTARETELLVLLARGSTYAEAAAGLGIGIGTVQSYVKTIYTKLDVTSKAEAAVAAMRLGLVT